ncbi:MAG: hypothetical protein WBQ76_11950 [Candidatus Korobacteraceae bacterium]
MGLTTIEDVTLERPADGRENTPSLPLGDEAEFSLAICEHIRPSGTRCGMLALRDQKFCYYHAKLRKTVPKNNLFVFLANPGRKENDPCYAFEFPYLEDAAAVQIAFMQFIYGVSQQRLEQWRARMILSALHGAAANLRLMDASAASYEKVQPEKKQPSSVKVGEVEQEGTA